MESVFNFSMTELLAFALVLLRMCGFIVTMPVIGSASVPTPIKVLFGLSMTFVVFPTIGWRALTADIESLAIVSMAVKEVAVGLFFGSIARLFFSAVSIAGQIMSVSLGISSAQLFNPAMGESSTAFDQLYVTLASLFFLSVNGHHLLIAGLVESFHIIPIQATSIHLLGLGEFGAIVEKIMVIGVKMSAPLMVTILFMNIAIAVVGRAVPQINILITSLPINILVGLMVVIISLPILIWQMNDLLDVTSTELFRLVKSF